MNTFARISMNCLYFWEAIYYVPDDYIIIIIRQALQEYMETRNLQLVTRGKEARK